MNSQATAANAGTIDVGGDLTVNRLGFGAMRITGPGIWGHPPDRDMAKAALRRAVELGVTFIDTADSYGPEVSENLIAETLYPYPDDLVIATKGGLTRPGPGRWVPDGRPGHLRRACEGSLRRLRLDQIPLYQFHRPDPKVPIEESIGALDELKAGGRWPGPPRPAGPGPAAGTACPRLAPARPRPPGNRTARAGSTWSRPTTTAHPPGRNARRPAGCCHRGSRRMARAAAPGPLSIARRGGCVPSGSARETRPRSPPDAGSRPRRPAGSGAPRGRAGL
jgi:hypothetical protein